MTEVLYALGVSLVFSGVIMGMILLWGKFITYMVEND